MLVSHDKYLGKGKVTLEVKKEKRNDAIGHRKTC